MRASIASIIGLSFIALASAAEAPVIQWTGQYGTTGGSADIVFATALDEAGGVYVAGQVFGTLDGQTSAGSSDAFVRKYDAAGKLVWTRQFGTGGIDIAFALAVEGGGVYVGGSVRGTLPGFSFAGVEDSFLRKYDTDGNLQWTDQFGSNALDQIRGIAVDTSVTPAAVYVGGQAVNALPGQTARGAADAFLRRYDDAGASAAPVWTRQFGTGAIDIGFAVALDGTGVYVAGRTDGDLDGAGPGTFGGVFDAFVQKYSADGTVLWTRQLGTPVSDVLSAVAADGTDVYVGGFTFGDLDGAGPGPFGNQDSFVARLHGANGDLAWARQTGTAGIDSANAVSVDAAGVHVAGRTDGSLAGPGSYAGVSDAYLQTYDANGTLLWTRQVGSLAFDAANGIASDGSSIYVGGQCDSPLPGEIADHGGNTDGFLIRYDAGGDAPWTLRFGTLGPVADFARAASRALDKDGNVYIAGDTRGTLPGQTTAGLADAYLRKVDSGGHEVWTRQYGSPLNDFGLAVAVGARGLACVAGRSDTAQPGQSYAGGLSDAYVKCFDSDGNERWTRQFGSAAFDNGAAVAIDSQGSVYVAGRTDGDLVRPHVGIFDAFVLKYDHAGNLLWARQFGSGVAEILVGAGVDGNDDLYVVGQTFGTLPDQPALQGGSDAFIRKYDGDGDELWTRQFGSALLDTANAVVASPSGDVYVGGNVAAALPGQTFLGGQIDAFVRKYDAEGDELWTRQFGTNLGDNVLALDVDRSGNLFAGGNVGGALPGKVSAGNSDGFVRKYAAGGDEVWTLQLGSNQRDSIAGVAVHQSRSQSGNQPDELVVCGDTDGALPGQTSAGDVDAFVIGLVLVGAGGPR